MVSRLLENPETRRILIYLGAAGLAAIVGGSVYAAAMNAVTPSAMHTAQNQQQNAQPATQQSPQVTQPTANVVSGDTASSQGGRTIVFEGQTLNVSVADTDASRQQGLSGRSGLAQNEGMLFIFPQDGVYGFWMKDMLFSIDMVWLSREGKVVYFIHDVPPDSYPASFIPDQPARYVLELPAGWTTAHGVRIGDQVSF